MPTKARLTREQIAARAAQLLPDGAYVNLGWGIPNLIADHLPVGVTVYFHSENGILGMGRRAKADEEDFDLVDAMKVPVTLIPGASFFHQADAHLMTRGGHLDVAVLGAFQVSERGDLANWKVPGAKGVGAIGGTFAILFVLEGVDEPLFVAGLGQAQQRSLGQGAHRFFGKTLNDFPQQQRTAHLA